MRHPAYRMDAEIGDFRLVERRRHGGRRNLGEIATVAPKRPRGAAFVMPPAGCSTAMSLRSPSPRAGCARANPIALNYGEPRIPDRRKNPIWIFAGEHRGYYGYSREPSWKLWIDARMDVTSEFTSRWNAECTAGRPEMRCTTRVNGAVAGSLSTIQSP